MERKGTSMTPLTKIRMRAWSTRGFAIWTGAGQPLRPAGGREYFGFVPHDPLCLEDPQGGGGALLALERLEVTASFRVHVFRRL